MRFEARYPGTCDDCGERFEAGEHIRSTGERTYAHDVCPEDVAQRPTRFEGTALRRDGLLMTPDQLDELARQFREATFADETMSLQRAENALRYVTHHPEEPLPAEVAELLLSALGRLHQVERAARAWLLNNDAGAGDELGTVAISGLVRDALRARMSNGASLDDEARR